MKFIKTKQTIFILFIIASLFFLTVKLVANQTIYNSFSVYAQTPTNLITNSGFENDLSGWSQQDGTGIIVTSPVHTGNKAYKSTGGYVTRDISVTANKRYKIVGWVYINNVSGGNWGGPTIDIVNTTTSPWSHFGRTPLLQDTLPKNTWSKVGYEFTPTTNSIRIEVGDHSDRIIDVVFDDIAVFEAPTTNTQPVITSINSDISTVTTLPGTVNFTSFADDPDGYFQSFWDFGDGGKSDISNPSHQFISNGVYNVTLTIVDDKGAAATSTKTITVNDPLSASITVTSPTSTTFSNPIINFSGTATPGTGATISKVEWSTDRGMKGTASGTNSWNFNLDLTNQGGKHKVLIAVTDSNGKLANKTIIVDYRPNNKVTVVNGASGITQNAASIEQYEKFEATFNIQNGVFSNPYVPYQTGLPAGMKSVEGNGVTVEAVFTSPTNKTYAQPGFYYQPYTRNTSNQTLLAQGQPVWKIRFAPQEKGNWTYQVKVTDASGTTTVSDNSKLTFNVIQPTNPNNHGFIKASTSDTRYFEFSDGTPFIGLGPGPSIDNSFSTDQNIAKVGTGNSNLSRTWMSGSNIGGSSWASWTGNIDYEGNYPGTSLTTEESYTNGIFSLQLPQTNNALKRCAFYGFQQNHTASVKPNTNYRILARIKTVSVPTSGGFNIRIGGINWPGSCDGYIGTSPFQAPVNGSKDWHVVTGNWNSASSNKLGYVLITLENVTSGRVYIDEISIREDLGGGNLGSEVLQRSKFNVHEYFSQETSWNWDYGLDEFAKRGLYEKAVIEEKGDFSFNHISPSGFGTSGFGYMQNIGGASHKYQQYYWRYLTARYGYARSVHSWEYVNEDAPGNLGMANEMAAYFHSIDPQRHLATTSFWCCIQNSGNYYWRDPAYPDIDYADAHAYVNAPPDNTSWLQDERYPYTIGDLTLSAYSNLSSDTALYPYAHGMDILNKNAAGNKPLIIGEVGIGNSSGAVAGADDSDIQGVWLHQFIWSQINPSGAYFIYWYGNTIESRNLYPLFGTYRKFMEGSSTDSVNTRVPLSNGNYQDIQLTPPANVYGWGQKDTVNGGAHFWMYDKGYTWTTPSGGASLANKTVSFTNLPAKTYTIEFWDTWTNQVTTQTRNHTGGTMTLTIPSAITQKDVAVKIYPQSGYPQPSPNPTTIPNTPSPTPKPGDCEPDGGDSDIDIFDYNRIVSNFGSSTNLSCDFVNLGSIDIFDYNTVVSNFGT